MTALSTPVSTGLMTTRRSWSVLDGTMCSSGITSPVASSWYWIRLWWEISPSSSTRMPVSLRVSVHAQVQNALSSAAVRSARTPLAGSSAHTRTACLPAEVIVRRSVTPPEVNSSPGVVAAAAARRLAVAVRWARTWASSAGIAGSRSRVRWSIRDLRWALVFRNATAVSLTGLGATQAAQRPGSSAARWAMSA